MNPIGKSIRLIGLAAALSALTTLGLPLTVADHALDTAYRQAFEARGGKTPVQTAATPASRAEHPGLQLTTFDNAALPVLYAPLAKGDRLAMNLPDGAIRLLEVTALRHINFSATGDAAGGQPSLILVTFRPVDPAQQDAVHVLMEQRSGPHHPPQDQFARPL